MPANAGFGGDETGSTRVEKLELLPGMIPPISGHFITANDNVAGNGFVVANDNDVFEAEFANAA